MFDEVGSAAYQHAVQGTWGEFVTPAGKVAYVLTKARLGKAGTDNERRLTSQLRPVREVLDPSTLDFNQLLQRDLDDHRVATELLPYLLNPSINGPSFFPPIMSVLLPFEGATPVDDFPEAQNAQPEEDGGVRYLERRFGDAFSVGRLAAPDGNLHPTIKLGRVRWNEELAKLVVLDGQHRAMALIAIDRTENKTWDVGPGARFRHFYEHRVRTLMGDGPVAESLESIEVPVVVCWFPDLHGPGSNAHKAARKLFVDVNKEARQPSEARLTLLSDTELLNIFTRALLNRLRQDKPPLPLYSIEYDNPDKDSARPVRWSVLANLNTLKYSVQYAVFGPEKHIKHVDGRFGGRPSWFKMNRRMREQLRVKELFPATIVDGERELDRDSLGNERFPITQLEKLTAEFQSGWGDAILHLLGNLEPYRAHASALNRLSEEWVRDDAMSSLAADALFVGVGMYWTLRESNDYWKAQCRRAKEEQRKQPKKPEIAKAWDVLTEKSKTFEVYRADAYLGSTNDKSVQAAADFYGIVNTHACQLGALLTVATICQRLDMVGKAIPATTALLTRAWNAALTSEVNQSRDRRLLFARESAINNPLNRIRKMDTPLAVYFRYFWLETLSLAPARAVWEGEVDETVVSSLLATARRNYLDYLIDEQVKNLKSSTPQADKAKLRAKASQIEEKALARALKHWFDMSQEDFDAWLAADGSDQPDDAELEDLEEDEDEDEDEDGGANGSSSDPVDVEELLKTIIPD